MTTTIDLTGYASAVERLGHADGLTRGELDTALDDTERELRAVIGLLESARESGDRVRFE